MTDKKSKRNRKHMDPPNTPEHEADGTNIAPEGNTPQDEQPVEVMLVAKDEFLALKQEVESAQQKVQDLSEGWQRERADFSNFRRRAERDQELNNQLFIGNFLKKILPAVDDLERALKTRPGVGEEASWSVGVELVYRKLLKILEQEGVTPIPSDIEEFDPAIHEAITHEDSPAHQSGEIIEVIVQGYKLGDRVLRPALVRVAR
jgi:molecular chaperone GrpE